MTPSERDAPTGGLARLWHHFPLKTHHGWMNLLLLAIPAAIGAHLAHASPLVIFLLAAVAIIPLAAVMGEATEVLSAYSGPLVGGILNGTMGNATELIIAFFALRAGHIEVVKASLSGSIIGNLLLVLGLAILLGGRGREKQTFSRTAAGSNSSMLFLAVAGLLMPAVYDLSVAGTLKHEDITVQTLSLWTSAVLIFIYVVSFVFMLKTHRALFIAQEEAVEKPSTSRKAAMLSLVLATVFIALMSEMLVDEIGSVTQTLGMTELFVGVIVVAIIGNAAEHSTAIMVAMRNKMDLAMTIAVGSSTQIALFVAPLLVFLSWGVGNRPMSLVFNGFELAAIALSVLIVEMISSDGESNWFEGAQLLALYVILGIAFYFVPA